MRAAKKKLQAMQRKAQEQGLLDANGLPVAGAATAAAKALPSAAQMMATLLSAQGGSPGAGAGAGMDPMAAQMAQLQRENAAMKAAMGI